MVDDDDDDDKDKDEGGHKNEPFALLSFPISMLLVTFGPG